MANIKISAEEFDIIIAALSDYKMGNYNKMLTAEDDDDHEYYYNRFDATRELQYRLIEEENANE